MDLKKIMYALAAVAVLLAGALAYIWYQKNQLVTELTIEKEELTAQMIDLQNDYASLSSDYDTINSQLDSSREEVTQLIQRIKKTEATNRSKIRQYEKELDMQAPQLGTINFKSFNSFSSTQPGEVNDNSKQFSLQYSTACFKISNISFLLK